MSKLIRLIKKQLKLIVKLPNGHYTNCYNCYDDIMHNLDDTMDTTEYLSEFCDVADFCYHQHWLNDYQYDEIYDTIRYISYINDIDTILRLQYNIQITEYD